MIDVFDMPEGSQVGPVTHENLQVLIRNIFKPGATLGEQRRAFESMKLLVVDLLCDLPASSVEAGSGIEV